MKKELPGKNINVHFWKTTRQKVLKQRKHLMSQFPQYLVTSRPKGILSFCKPRRREMLA
jgi:hypothetical protein